MLAKMKSSRNNNYTEWWLLYVNIVIHVIIHASWFPHNWVNVAELAQLFILVISAVVVLIKRHSFTPKGD